MPHTTVRRMCVAILIATVATVASAEVRVIARQPAGLFITGEPLSFVIETDGPAEEIAWAVTDYHAATVAEGTLMVGGGASTELRINERLAIGYYTLRLSFAAGGTFDRPFCVLPPPEDGRGDGGIFGVGYEARCETEWDILQRLGVRHVRSEFPWTVVEPEAGRFDLSRVREVIEEASERNLQVTVLTGHTPRHYGQKPVDARGRVETAWYTWQPATTMEWHRFISVMADNLLGHSLPPDPPSPTDTLARTPRPLVRGWEIWSEADQNFYYGDWDRYLDMLRIAWGTIRSRERVPVIYGSCGHWTEMALTCIANCHQYFDRIAYHPHGEDPDYEIMHWFRNMPQVLIDRGAPRETYWTETDFRTDDRETEPGFILRLYATLRSWRQRDYIRSGCTGGVIGWEWSEAGLVQKKNGQPYIPRPAAVAYALSRWLLESAAYVGPIDAPAGARLELFMRDGEPMIIGWSAEGPHQVQIDVTPRAELLTCMGFRTPLSGPTTTVTLDADAVAIFGVSRDYIAEAACANVERRLTTELNHVSPTNSGYINVLETDTDSLISPQFADNVRAAVAEACDPTRTPPAHCAAALFGAQRIVGDGMLAVVRHGRQRGHLYRNHYNTIWRLAQFVEDLGEIADGVGARWRRMNNVSASDLQSVRAMLAGVRERAEFHPGGGECAQAVRLLDRAEQQLRLVTESGGHRRGAWWAATLQVRAAHAMVAVEERINRRAFVVLPPRPDHELSGRVYNFLPREISGRIAVEMPEQWGRPVRTASFTAPSGGFSGPIPISFAVPSEPTPWVVKTAYRPWESLPVRLPEPLPANSEIWATARIAHAADPPPMRYRLCVGSYPGESAPEQVDHPLAMPAAAPARRPLLSSLRPAATDPLAIPECVRLVTD